jgi:uncharacterized membrane protein
LPLLPFVAGLLILAVVAVRVGQGGSRLSGFSPVPVRDARLSRVSPVPVRDARQSLVGPGSGSGPGPGPDCSSLARTDRDDDRFWKAGLFYVNRDDPSVMVGNRFGIGWTFNFGNRTACLVFAGIIAAPAGLAAIMAAAGM